MKKSIQLRVPFVVFPMMLLWITSSMHMAPSCHIVVAFMIINTIPKQQQQQQKRQCTWTGWSTPTTRTFHDDSTKTASSALHLIPAQGNQLIAASSTAYGIMADDDDDNDQRPTAYDDDGYALTSHHNDQASASSPSSLGALRKRIRSIAAATAAHDLFDEEDIGFNYEEYHPPLSTSSISNGHHPIEDSSSYHHHYPDRVEIFPIVGFVYVNDAPDHSRPLPTISQAACPLHDQDMKDQILYGWYTAQLCHLLPPQQ